MCLKCWERNSTHLAGRSREGALLEEVERTASGKHLLIFSHKRGWRKEEREGGRRGEERKEEDWVSVRDSPQPLPPSRCPGPFFHAFSALVIFVLFVFFLLLHVLVLLDL
jgi:hypothetical protein